VGSVANAKFLAHSEAANIARRAVNRGSEKEQFGTPLFGDPYLQHNLSFALLLNLISILLGRSWLRVPVFVLLTVLVFAPGYGAPSFATLERLVASMLIVAVTLTRFGVLATVALTYVRFLAQEFPLTTNWSAWYVQVSLMALATLMALALYGFVTTLRGRPLSQIRPRGLSANAA
jgi:hypothetical protein